MFLLIKAAGSLSYGHTYAFYFYGSKIVVYQLGAGLSFKATNEILNKKTGGEIYINYNDRSRLCANAMNSAFV